jgi:signal transduction histidine kinase/ligand-binding sensor domain-containing protein
MRTIHDHAILSSARILVRIVRYAVVFLYVLLAGGVSALDADRTLAQLHHTAWTAKDGAPSQISALAQTTDGYLWIGSARGLFRFDGAAFELYTPPAGVTLPSHNTYALLATRDGGLWISFRPSGLGFLKDGRMTIYTNARDIPRTQVYTFAGDRDGRVWAGTHDGLALRDGNRWIDIDETWNFKPDRVQSLFVDRDGGLWVTTASSLRVLRRGAKRFEVVLALDPLGSKTTHLAQAADGRIWLSEFDRSLWPVGGAAREAIPIDYAEDVIFDRSGCAWVSVNGDGIRRVCLSTNGLPSIEAFRAAQGLSSDIAPKVIEDREGNVWIGTAKGLDRFRHAHFVAVPLPSNHLKLTLAAGQNGEIWAASAAVGTIARVRRDGSVAVEALDQIASVFRDADGVLWWGGLRGLWRNAPSANGDGAAFALAAFPELDQDWSWELFPDDGGTGIWIGYGDLGLLHYRDGTFVREPHPAGLPDVSPSATYRDPQGRIWLGYKGNRIGLLERGAVRWFTNAHGIDIGRIRVIRGRGPHYWLGGELGLAVYRDGRFHAVRTQSGERFGTVSGIIETADGTLWLNEMRGVVRITASEIRALLRDPKRGIAFERFDLLDGLPGAPQMNWTVSTAVEGTDGRLWFATDNGLAWIHPERLTTNPLPPPVSIVSVSSGDRHLAPSPRISFPIGTQSLDIRYAALSLAMPERVTFRYMLEGVDETWQEAGTRREAFYTKLKPGTYRFRVIAANNDGVWNEQGASVSIELPPAFYQTKWFLALAILLVIALMLLINDVRVRRIAARIQSLHDERLDERMRIAHELHDTLLQGVASASMQLHVVDERLPGDSPAKPLLSNVVALMRRVAEEGRQAVQGLRPSGGSEPLEQSFARVRQELGDDSATAFRVNVTGRTRALHPFIRDEIHRIGREALLNAFQHSSAQNIEIALDYQPAQLTIRVRDDGRGIDPQVLQAGREGHWGLTGIRERASHIGARLRVSSRNGEGTEVELIVPSTAYLPGGRRRRTSTDE